MNCVSDVTPSVVLFYVLFLFISKIIGFSEIICRKVAACNAYRGVHSTSQRVNIPPRVFRHFITTMLSSTGFVDFYVILTSEISNNRNNHSYKRIIHSAYWQGVKYPGRSSRVPSLSELQSAICVLKKRQK